MELIQSYLCPALSAGGAGKHDGPATRSSDTDVASTRGLAAAIFHLPVQLLGLFASRLQSQMAHWFCAYEQPNLSFDSM